MADLFISLGYDEPRLNIHRTGREVDVEAKHRTEPRLAIAECKAEKKKTGGDAINKFVGSLDVEIRKRQGVPITGYFISLYGFAETTHEQEKEAGGNRVILLDGPKVVHELVLGRIIVSPDFATERAGRCASDCSEHLELDYNCELLAHHCGWIWAVYYLQGKQRTHFALVHADGNVLAAPLVKQVVAADRSRAGSLHKLKYLPPKHVTSASQRDVDAALAKYHTYLASECGQIVLDGLPADNDMGARRLKLEALFVPLHLEESIPVTDEGRTDVPNLQPPKNTTPERKPLGEVLATHNRLAILGPPGAGKSTLIKRLAVAYIDPARRAALDDQLPSRTWLPILIRCRELGELARDPIISILNALSLRAEINDYKEPFSAHLSEALHSGDVLILIDGLDEISDDSARLAFAKQLRIFLSIYPTLSVVLTSREPGFRVIGGALTAHCHHYRVAQLDENDIRRLTVAWHLEVFGDKKAFRIDADNLALSIIENDRILQLARNPLLLTTLLLVKRWIGQLPTRRTVLYGKAIEVLLMTWNVEAHQPLDQDEVIPQLAFVAYTMIANGTQNISRKRLFDTLSQARRQMPEVLAYVKLSVSDLIQQVELRSSLLMLSGHAIEDGTLMPMYEFRHLTFQEYLAARAIVDGYYSDRQDSDTILTILQSHVSDANWREVIPLAAVLAGRRVEPFVQHLVRLTEQHAPESESVNPAENKAGPVLCLHRLILDEVQVSPPTLRAALHQICRHRYSNHHIPTSRLLYGKFADVLREVAKEGYTQTVSEFFAYGGTLADITIGDWTPDESPILNGDLSEKITTLLNSPTAIDKASGALACMEFAFWFAIARRQQKKRHPDENGRLAALADKLLPLLFSEDVHLYFPACWAFAWVGSAGCWTPPFHSNVLPRLLQLWRTAVPHHVKRVSAWAIATQVPYSRDINPFSQIHGLTDFVREQYEIATKDPFFRNASVVIAYYARAPWPDAELAKMLVKGDKETTHWETGRRLLKDLGEAGQLQFKQLRARAPLTP